MTVRAVRTDTTMRSDGDRVARPANGERAAPHVLSRIVGNPPHGTPALFDRAALTTWQRSLARILNRHRPALRHHDRAYNSALVRAPRRRLAVNDQGRMMMAESTTVPGRLCGSCTLCCKVLGITELQKPGALGASTVCPAKAVEFTIRALRSVGRSFVDGLLIP